MKKPPLEVLQLFRNPGRSWYPRAVVPDFPECETDVTEQVHVRFCPGLRLFQGITKRVEDKAGMSRLLLVQGLCQRDTQQIVIGVNCFAIQDRKSTRLNSSHA